MNGAIAYITAVSSTSDTAMRVDAASVTASPWPATTTPTPPKPTSRPTIFMTPTVRWLPITNPITVAHRGTVATSRPVSPDGTVCSAWLSRKNGPPISIAANASTHGHFRSAGRSAFRCRASGSRSRAPTSVRPDTTAAGENDATASLMNRYGTPHSSAIAANSHQPFALIRAFSHRPPTLERAPERDLVGVLQVAAHGEPGRQARHGDLQRVQQARQIRRGGLALQVGVRGE